MGDLDSLAAYLRTSRPYDFESKGHLVSINVALEDVVATHVKEMDRALAAIAVPLELEDGKA